MTSKIIGLLIPSFLATQAHAAVSMPLHACTNYASRLMPFFEPCAEFSVARGRNGCTKVKGICPACVTYQGDDLQMWLPDYFVELTPHVGRSVFAESTAGAGLNLHLKGAKAWWDKTLPSIPLLANGTGSENSHSMSWHARILPVPFGATINTYPPLASSKGVGFPTCYTAVSELIPAQWKYGLADLPFALALSPLIVPMCFATPGIVAAGQTVAGLASSATSMGSGGEGGMSDIPNGCARPIYQREAFAKNMMPSSDVWNPGKLCIGTLGPLLPRVGEIASDEPFKTALTVGVKFASITSDFFGDRATGGWDLTDKWQLIYPPSPHGYCFRPGQLSQILEVPFGVVEDGVTRVSDNLNMSGAKANVKANVYVFAVWRKRNTCQEPIEPAWTADYKLNRAKNQALCKASSFLPN